MPAKKAKPKPKAAPAPEPVSADDAVVVPEVAQEGDQHIIPERDYSKNRPHDAVRGCWCFPQIKGNEVQHR